MTKNDSGKSWYSKPIGCVGQGLVIDEATGNNIAVVYSDETDGPLIAAAPDLLAALRVLLETHEHYADADDIIRADHFVQMRIPIQAARAAIAKATELAQKPTRKNTMLDVAFTVIHELAEAEDLLGPANVHLVCDALQKRIDYLRENPQEAADAFGVCDTYEMP